MINTHEGHKQPWTTEEEDFVLIRYSIMEAAKVCEPRGIKLGLEMHQTYSLIPEKYDRILNLVDSPVVGANFDTGNAYLGGIDPIAWLERIKHRLVHMHAKDITVEQSDAERGKVMGTRRGLRLRRRRDRLATGRGGHPFHSAGYRAERRVRHAGPGRPQHRFLAQLVRWCMSVPPAHSPPNASFAGRRRR